MDEVTLHSRVRIRDDVLLQNLDDESVLLNLKTGIYLGLNAVGTRIWALIQEDGSLEKVLAAILQTYDVTEERCKEDLLGLVQKMKEQQLIDVTPE
jgi:hypothetical protein